MGRKQQHSDANHLVAVITGDIIASREAGKTEQWLAPLKEALDQYGKSPENWEIYRGDSFQLEVLKPVDSLRIGIKLKADIMSQANVMVRLGIGIGSKSYNAKRVTESNGDAFVHSGEAFDGLSKVAMAIRSPWPDLDKEMNLHLILAHLIIDHWTPSSAEAVSLMMEPDIKTQKEAAQKLGISQASVSGRLQRAGYEEIMQVIMRFQELMSIKISINDPST